VILPATNLKMSRNEEHTMILWLPATFLALMLLTDSGRLF